MTDFLNFECDNLVDEVTPCVSDVWNIAVICGVVNEKADIVVTCLVGVVVIELATVSIQPIASQAKHRLTSSRG
jgi:hypothetical protein